MKIRTLTATALLAVFAVSTASAGKLELNSSNYSNGSIAVGDVEAAGLIVTPPSGAGAYFYAGGRAIAGSVSLNVKGCGCKKTIDIENHGAGSIAVGNATAGSTRLNLY